MPIPKKTKKGILILLVISVISYPVYLFFRDEPNIPTPYEYPTWNFKLSGDISVETTKSFEDLIEGGYTIVENIGIQTKNNYGTITDYTVTGFPLMTLIDDLGLTLLDYEAILICSSDGYSKILTRSAMELGETDEIIVAYAINGVNLTETDGYLKLMVNRTIADVNSIYCIKNLVEIRFLPRWDLEIKVNGASTSTTNISYYQLMSSSYKDITVTDQYFNATKNGGLWQEFHATGIMLWNLTTASYLNLDLTDCDAINFTGDDGYEKKLTLSVTNLELYFNQIIIAYKWDGEFLLRPNQNLGKGPIRPAINQTVTSTSYTYSVSNLRTIEFWDSTP
jgi:hypothetical protein